MEKSDVLQFITADQKHGSVRPSGTETQDKVLFQRFKPLDAIDRYDAVGSEPDAKLERIKKDLRLNREKFGLMGCGREKGGVSFPLPAFSEAYFPV